MRTLHFLVRKEFLQIWRDPAMLRIALGVPIVQLLVLAHAATFELKNVRVAVYDQDRTPASRLLAERVMECGENLFRPAGYGAGPRHLQSMLAAGRADATLWIPRGFAASFVSAQPIRLFAQVDGRNASLAGQTGGYLSQAAAAVVSELAAAQGVPSSGLRPRSSVEVPVGDARIAPGTGASGYRTAGRVIPHERFLYNPELESKWYMVPGIVAMLAAIISGMMTGMAVVREREIGTLEQLMVTPITPAQLIAGKTIPFGLLSVLEMALATGVGMLVFRVPMVGSPLLYALAAVVFLFVTLSGGLLASTVSSTQQQAMFTVWFFLILSIILSGFFFPLENMPEWIQPITWLNPLRYFMALIRGIFLKGLTLPEMLPHLAPLLAIGLVMFTAAVLRFHKRVS